MKFKIGKTKAVNAKISESIEFSKFILESIATEEILEMKIGK